MTILCFTLEKLLRQTKGKALLTSSLKKNAPLSQRINSSSSRKRTHQNMSYPWKGTRHHTINLLPSPATIHHHLSTVPASTAFQVLNPMFYNYIIVVVSEMHAKATKLVENRPFLVLGSGLERTITSSIRIHAF